MAGRDRARGHARVYPGSPGGRIIPTPDPPLEAGADTFPPVFDDDKVGRLQAVKAWLRRVWGWSMTKGFPWIQSRAQAMLECRMHFTISVSINQR
jgi:hypothetical protein